MFSRFEAENWVGFLASNEVNVQCDNGELSSLRMKIIMSNKGRQMEV